MVHLYYGMGKGKTTAAVGLAMRMAGAGGRVVFYSFLKDNSSSERLAMKGHVELIEGRESEKFFIQMTDAEKAEAREYYSEKLREIMAGCCCRDMIVLDEAGSAIDCGLIDEEELIRLIDDVNAEVVLTAHEVSQRLIDRCDYVTEMRKVKHPYDEGAPARRGVEF